MILMTDPGKVINGIECLLTDRKCELFNCPYGNVGNCIDAVLYDALALLKEQAARIRELEEKFRALEYGDRDTLKSAMAPAT